MYRADLMPNLRNARKESSEKFCCKCALHVNESQVERLKKLVSNAMEEKRKSYVQCVQYYDQNVGHQSVCSAFHFFHQISCLFYLN